MQSINGSNTKPELRDKWRTPPEVFARLNSLYNFNLDAYADDKDALCPNYIGEDDNAHIVQWRDYVDGNRLCAFANPPYSQPNIKHSLVAARREARRGGTVVLLIPNQPAQYWKDLVIGQANHIIVSLGRLSFVDPESGKPVGGNAGGSAVITFAPRSPRTRRLITATSYMTVEELMAPVE